MSRRDEREIARRLADLPAGPPPADLLARLQADLPPALAVGEEAAARRRPAALDRRWLLAASLAAMAGAGAVSLHLMRQMPSAPSAPVPRAAERQAAPAGAGGPPEAVGVVAPPAQGPARSAGPTGRLAPQRLVSPRPAAPRATKLLADGLPTTAGEVSPPEGPLTVLGEEPERAAPVPSPAAPPSHDAAIADEAKRRRQGELAAGSGSAPSPPPPAALMRQRQEATTPSVGPAAKPGAKLEQRLDQRMDVLAAEPAAETAAADAPAARPPTLWAPEVAALAAAYDDDAAGKDGWTLAAGGTPPPPKVAGRPASGPPAGALWVRFRVRAAAATEPAVPEAARIEIAWSSRLLAARRILGGGREAGPADAFAVSGDELRRGWTIVYEIRLTPAAGAAGERLATLLLRTGAGAPLREVGLTAADFAPSWIAALAGLRLPCLAAGFAERRATGGGDGYADFLAAARDLAEAGRRGDRRAASLLARMARAERARPAGPP